MARITAAYYHQIIRGIDNLSDSTKAKYIERLERITTHISPGHSLHYTLKHPAEFMRNIAAMPANNGNRHHMVLSYLSPILAIYRALPEYRAVNNDTFLKWSKLFTLELARKDRLYNKKRTEDDLPTTFATLVAMRDSLPLGTSKRLLLAMTTYIPPLGNDYGAVRIYTASQRPPTNRIDANYIWLRTNNPVFVVMRKKAQYRTRNTNENRPYFSISLPPVLVAVIRETNRTFLFSTNDGRPMTEGYFNQWANGTLKELFGETMTMRHLRDLYVIEQFRLGKSAREMEEIGRVMGQSFVIQDRLDPRA